MLGTFILWFGWYGFNCGSALVSQSAQDAGKVAALAAVNTTLSAGMAGITSLFFQLWLLERRTGEPFFELKYAMNGALGGLVAITGGCGIMEPWAAVAIGFVAGFIYIGSSNLLLKLRLDDAVDAIPVHLMNGIWGSVAVGLFASPTFLEIVYGHSNYPGWVYAPTQARLLGCQLVGLLFIIGWVMVIMLPFFVWLDWKGWFRSDPLEEVVGLDTSYHGGLAMQSSGEEVNPAYISAYQKKKDEMLRNRRPNLLATLPEVVSEDSMGGIIGAELDINSLSTSRTKSVQSTGEDTNHCKENKV